MPPRTMATSCGCVICGIGYFSHHLPISSTIKEFEQTYKKDNAIIWMVFLCFEKKE